MNGRFASHGRRFEIESSDPDVVAAFDEVLGDMAGTDDRGRLHRITIDPVTPELTTYRVAVDGRTVYPTLDAGSLLTHVIMEINHHVADAAWSSGLIPLHASTVAFDGRCLLVVGASHSGKTTLATALAATDPDTEFLADEVTAVDPQSFAVVPYRKPVALRSSAVELLTPTIEHLRAVPSRFELDERLVPPSRLGPATSALGPNPLEPPTASAIVFSRYEAHLADSDARLSPVRPLDALPRLMLLMLGDRRVGVDTFRSIERLVRSVDVYDSVHYDAIVAADRLRAIFRAS